MKDQPNDVIALANQYGAHNYEPLPVAITKGEGAKVWDIDGKEYLDCLSAYSAVNQGHAHPKIVEALIQQAHKITLTSRAFHNDTMGPFLEKLCKLSGFEKALPMNTGAEAVETAIKAARRWGYQKKKVPANKAEIIVCTNNFHGRTLFPTSASSDEEYREGFGPFIPGIVKIPFGDIHALENAITQNTVAFMVEPIQGEAGIIVPPKGYLTQVSALCHTKEILFILDEIQTGFARTGRLFCYEHEDSAKPDILVVGKALSGGVYPVSGILASKDVMDVFTPGSHGSTFGGNPLACAVATAALDVIIDENLTERAQELGQNLMEKIRGLNLKAIKEVRGMGLLIGLELTPEAGEARPYCEELMKRGILVKDTHHKVIRIAPPLVVSQEDLENLVKHLQEVLTAPKQGFFNKLFSGFSKNK